MVETKPDPTVGIPQVAEGEVVLALCVHCDACKRDDPDKTPPFTHYSPDTEVLITKAKGAGWQVVRDKKKADDLCPKCIKELNRRVRG